MYENHQKLKGARQEARVLEQEVEKLETELNQEKQKNARLEEDVKSYHDRHMFLKKAEVLKMKKPWLVSPKFVNKLLVSHMTQLLMVVGKSHDKN